MPLKEDVLHKVSSQRLLITTKMKAYYRQVETDCGNPIVVIMTLHNESLRALFCSIVFCYCLFSLSSSFIPLTPSGCIEGSCALSFVVDCDNCAMIGHNVILERFSPSHSDVSDWLINPKWPPLPGFLSI